MADRYEMSPLDGPTGMAERLKKLEQRLSALERGKSSGSFASADANGDGLVYLGNLPDGSRGLQIDSEANNWTLAKFTSDGWVKPHLMGSPWKTTDSFVTTSATLVDTFAVTFGEALGPGVEVGFPWATGSGTTGEVQVTSNLPTSSGTLALPAAGSGYHFLRWLHGAAPGIGPLELRIKARRTAGAGNVTIFPCQAWVQDPALCTSGGTWI